MMCPTNSASEITSYLAAQRLTNDYEDEGARGGRAVAEIGKVEGERKSDKLSAYAAKHALPLD